MALFILIRMALVNPFEHAISLLEQFGFFQTLLPILLVFILFYAVLQKSKVLGTDEEKTKPLNSAFAFISAFFVVTSTGVIDTINQLLPSAALLLLLAALLLLLLGMFSWKPDDFSGDGSGAWGKVGAAVMLLVFLGMIDMTLGLQIPIIHDLAMMFTGQSASGAVLSMSDDDMAVLMSFVIMFGLFFLVGYFIFRSGPKKTKL